MADSNAEAGSREAVGGVWATTAVRTVESGGVCHCTAQASPTQERQRGWNEGRGSICAVSN